MFLSGNEAVAEAVRLAKPHVIPAYPITPQTTIVEHIAQMVADGKLNSEYIHVESEHSALAAALGASMTGARTFTATSSQGLLYMAEVLTYAAGGRFPIVMANTNRALALPWNIYGDQRDSLSLLDHGWIQAYAKNNQEACDLILFAYKIAENAQVMTPFMVNLDGFALTHTYERVDVPNQAQVDGFLPAYSTDNCFDFEHPKNLGYSAGPQYNWRYKKAAHEGMLKMWEALEEAESEFVRIFGRSYSGGIEAYKCEDATKIIITLGSVSSLVEGMVDELREQGEAVGLLRIRYMRPFPAKQIAEVLQRVCSCTSGAPNAVSASNLEDAQHSGAKNVKATDYPTIAVLEKDISFGAAGTVYTNVCSVLHEYGIAAKTFNYIGGLGGADIKPFHIKRIFKDLVDSLDKAGRFNSEAGNLNNEARNVKETSNLKEAHKGQVSSIAALHEPIFIDAWQKEEEE